MTTALDSLGLLGTTIAGKYALESVVGQGGFAIVYRAQHLLWKRPVAVKVFTALGEVAEGQREKLLEDFIQEGALLADLSERSTAIVQARDIGMLVTAKGDSVPYMVLEWLEGAPLEDVLAKEHAANAPLRSLEDVVRWLDPIGEALALAHKKGIAHRDVKPANIFILSEGSLGGVKLLDFGIAKVVQDAQKLGFGRTAGHITSFTPLYGAPEQFNRSYGSTGPWTDVFALALVVAEVASGKEPMSGDTIMQLAVASADERVRPTPRTLGVSISDDVEAIFAKAVAVKPEARFQNAADFWNALRSAVIGDRLTSMASSRMPSVSRYDIASDAAVATTALAVAPPLTSGASTVSGASGQLTSPDTRGAWKSRAKVLVVVAVAVGALAVGGAVGVRALQARDGSQVTPAGTAPLPSSALAVPFASAPVSAISPPKDCADGMVMIPGGEFFMGSEETDVLDREAPAHKVKLSPYCLDPYETTVAEYRKCSDRGACRRAGKENVWPGITNVQRKIYDPLCTITDPVAKATHPVNCVDWDQAREACEARGARLPTEAEWEFAARGPDGRTYPWGDDPPSAKLLNACGKECVAWQRAHPEPDTTPALMYAADDGYPNTAPVGSFPEGKSRYGIYDVVGNVWEWVADFHADYEQGAASATMADPKGPLSGTARVIRGGAWNGSKTAWLRPSVRFHVAQSARSYGFGFRCAKSL